jgi:hypothetical protein
LAVSDAVKGGLFVAAAVATGLLAGFLLPSIVGAGDTASRSRPHASLPTMPSVVGRPLDAAGRELRRRKISYASDAPDIVEAVVPQFLEVCESEPSPGGHVRGSARLHVAVTGTCGL